MMQFSDVELMQKIKDGDIQAFDCLVRRWENRLFNLVHKIIGDFEAAKDICQEVFLRVYQTAKRYQPISQFETWFYRIAINCSLNELKKRKRHPNLSLQTPFDNEDEDHGRDLFDPEPQPDEIAQQNEMDKYVRDALAHLPDDQRIVIILRHYEGLKFQEIASILNCPLGTVKSRMYWGIEHLRTMLKHLLV